MERTKLTYPQKQEAWYPSFGPDDERLTYLTNLTGTHQLWASGDGWPRQLTFFDERVTFGSWSPVREELVFGKDSGGNERTKLYRLDRYATTITPLVDDSDAVFRWGGWSNGGELMAYTANTRHPAVFDIHVQRRDELVADPSETLVCEGDSALAIAGWSPNDRRLALTKSNSNYDQEVYVFDRRSGDLEHVTPHDGDVRFSSVCWAPSGDALYLLTDDGSDTLYVARLELETGELFPVVRGGDWNVQGMNFHHESGRLLYGRNVDGFIELTTVALEGRAVVDTFPDPDVPRGVVGGSCFTADGSRLAIPITNRTLPPNIFIIDIETGQATQETHATVSAIAPEELVSPDLIRYESFDDETIPALYSVPRNSSPGDTPVIVDIHGGPESQRTAAFSEVAQYFLKQGLAVFEPNVRGSLGYGKEYAALDDVRNRMDAVRDVEAGVEWLRNRPEVDSTRIVAFGASYGGFVVLATLTRRSDLWAGGIDISGISNFVTFLENTSEWRRPLREAEYGSLSDDREFLESISPINDIDQIEAALLVVHGENDPRVPVSEAEQLVAKAREHDVTVEQLLFPDEGHGLSKRQNRIETYHTITDFLSRVL